MSRSKKAFLAISGATATVLLNSSVSAGLTVTASNISGFPRFWPASPATAAGETAGQNPVSNTGFDPLIFGGNGNVPGAPNNGGGATVPETVGNIAGSDS